MKVIRLNMLLYFWKFLFSVFGLVTQIPSSEFFSITRSYLAKILQKDPCIWMGKWASLAAHLKSRYPCFSYINQWCKDFCWNPVSKLLSFPMPVFCSSTSIVSSYFFKSLFKTYRNRCFKTSENWFIRFRKLFPIF